jgi:epoxyqueuosine reductase
VKETIRQRALELGFDECGFTSAAPPASSVHFQRWLEAQCHGEMNWMRRTEKRRSDPQQVLAGAQTIICLAASYYQKSLVRDKYSVADKDSTSQRQTSYSAFGTPHYPGVIARYARFTDYHDVLGQRLKQLADFVNTFDGEGAHSLWYVDTGPLLERDLAQRAGIGFIGKHTNLIGRRLGNWCFLGEILTTLKLSPDAAETNHCGTCTRCMTACPTNAITAPFELDARRCISYLTIEIKGSIPVEWRAAIGSRIFGCDDCLAVCPWNRFAREGRLMRDHARPDLHEPDLIDLLALDEPGFKHRFAGTPILRTKRRGLLRNVCVALGNVGTHQALPALSQAANDPEPLIREHARWAMEQIEQRGNLVPGQAPV